VEPGRAVRIGTWRCTAHVVPHARDPGTPTLAWRITTRDGKLVYASDVARPEPGLAQLARGADVLVIDGATYRRTIFSHLRIDRDLPKVCGWRVKRVFLTQIGRSAPPHEELVRIVAELCPRAVPAYDGLTVELSAT
jgi:ribonuclease BN (tRNA processing enzyme)